MIALIYVIGTPLGVYLAPRVGLPISPALERALNGEKFGRTLTVQCGKGFLVGLPLLIAVAMGLSVMSRLLHVPQQVSPIAVGGRRDFAYFSLAAAAAPLYEEITERLFLFSALARFAGAFRSKRSGKPGLGAMWVANVGQGLISGLAHVVAGATGLPIGPWYEQITISPQTCYSVILGCVYWRYGLESSMFVHFSANFTGVIQVALSLRKQGLL
jgi:membrane protease YdiL (CAAX protease family)